MLVHFPKNVLNRANTRIIEVECPQTDTFSKKYPKCLITVMCHKESDERFFVKQIIGEDSDDNGSNDEDPSRVYKEIKPDDNITTHQRKFTMLRSSNA